MVRVRALLGRSPTPSGVLAPGLACAHAREVDSTRVSGPNAHGLLSSSRWPVKVDAWQAHVDPRHGSARCNTLGWKTGAARMPSHSTKRPSDRYGSHPTGPGDDPRYIQIAQGQSTKDEIAIPSADPKWKPTARSWFNSLGLSGQSEFYEASDWATAVAAAEAYDVFLKTHNASIFAQFVRLSERLGCTVTDRKRSRIELALPEVSDEDEDEADEALTSWHSRLRVGD